MKRRGRAPKRQAIDERALREAVKAAVEQPRLAFYSPLASAVLNYWKNTRPRYSISSELSKIVEEEVKKRWPQLANKASSLLKRPA